MIISHKNRFVYVKPGKTAGSSIEMTLSQFCGAQDIVTRLRGRDENHRPQPCAAEIARPVYRHRITGEDLVLNNHAPYAVALRIFGEQIADYDVVCSERNPWEKAISSFYWKGNRRPERPEKPRFNNFVRDQRFPKDFDVYSLFGVPVVDHVLRVEALATDLDHFVAGFGGSLEGGTKIVKVAKAFTRPDHATREAMFDKPWVIRAVADATTDLRRLLPYTFEGRAAPDYVPHPDRRRIRDRFLQENDCGPAFWERVDS